LMAVTGISYTGASSCTNILLEEPSMTQSEGGTKYKGRTSVVKVNRRILLKPKSPGSLLHGPLLLRQRSSCLNKRGTSARDRSNMTDEVTL
jgi:hypothetical protein